MDPRFAHVWPIRSGPWRRPDRGDDIKLDHSYLAIAWLRRKRGEGRFATDAIEEELCRFRQDLFGEGAQFEPVTLGYSDPANHIACGKRTAGPASADADVGLHQRVDPFGQPQQGGAARAVQRELVAAVKHGVAQLREAALDEAALKEPEAAQRPEGVVVAERDQCAEIAEAVWRH
jgi:hypothetical protein